MDSNTFVKWLFSPKDFAAMSDLDLSSPSPSESHPTSSTNAPSDPNQAEENPVTEELERLDLQGSCSIQLERDSIGEAENGTSGEQAEEVEEAIEEEAREEEEEEEIREEEEEESREEEEEEEEEQEEEEEDEEEEEALGENGSWSDTEKEDKYPVRPGAEDCAYYMRTRSCKYGSNCRFNHPTAVLRKFQAGKDEADHGEAAKHHSWQVECKYYLSPGGCKFGKACKFSHSRTNLAAPSMELNFLGLPIRPGEKECVYFMRTGTCKYAANCRFNHPDPTSTAGGDNAKPTMEYSGSRSRLGSPPQPQPQPQPQFPASGTSWSPPVGTMNESTPRFVPMMYSSTTQSSKAEWNNGYQFPVNQAAAGQSSSMAPRPPYIMHNSTAENHMMYTNNQQQQQQQMVMNEYPERPGQPECTYFMRNGDCKFKSNCKFHHPKERISKSPPHHAAVAFSNHGLPLRTDQNICTHYSRYGICRFGPSCKFDHPDDPSNASRNRRIDHQQQSSFGTSSRATGHSGGAWPSSKPQVISL